MVSPKRISLIVEDFIFQDQEWRDWGGGELHPRFRTAFKKRNKSGFGVVLSCHNQMDREGFRIFCSFRTKRRNRKKKRSLMKRKKMLIKN